MNDLQLKDQGFKNYPDIVTDSLWLCGARDKSEEHENNYHGLFIPQVPRNLIQRYTKAGDVVVDLFAGSGTTLKEAKKLGRKCLGVELKKAQADAVNDSFLGRENALIECWSGDSKAPGLWRSINHHLDQNGFDRSPLVILHPPYWDIVPFSDDPRCLANFARLDQFLFAFELVARNAEHICRPGGHIAVVIGEIWKDGEIILLPWLCYQRLQEMGLKLRSNQIKDIQGNERAKGRNKNLWRYRHLKNGTSEFKHEYIGVFRKPRKQLCLLGGLVVETQAEEVGGKS